LTLLGVGFCCFLLEFAFLLILLVLPQHQELYPWATSPTHMPATGL
jgi:hypothetical protein